MAMTVIICHIACRCQTSTNAPVEPFLGDPTQKINLPTEEHFKINWLHDYVSNGPCTSVEGANHKELHDIATSLIRKALPFLKKAHSGKFSESDGVEFLGLMSDMSRLPLEVKRGQVDREGFLSLGAIETEAAVDYSVDTYSGLLLASYVQVIEEVAASVVAAKQGLEDRIDHHVALTGDIISIFWNALNTYTRAIHASSQ